MSLCDPNDYDTYMPYYWEPSGLASRLEEWPSWRRYSTCVLAPISAQRYRVTGQFHDQGWFLPRSNPPPAPADGSSLDPREWLFCYRDPKLGPLDTISVSHDQMKLFLPATAFGVVGRVDWRGGEMRRLVAKLLFVEALATWRMQLFVQRVFFDDDTPPGQIVNLGAQMRKVLSKMQFERPSPGPLRLPDRLIAIADTIEMIQE